MYNIYIVYSILIEAECLNENKLDLEYVADDVDDGDDVPWLNEIIVTFHLSSSNSIP